MNIYLLFTSLCRRTGCQEPRPRLSSGIATCKHYALLPRAREPINAFDICDSPTRISFKYEDMKVLDERHATACRMSSKGTPPNRAMDVDTALMWCRASRVWWQRGSGDSLHDPSGDSILRRSTMRFTRDDEERVTGASKRFRSLHIPFQSSDWTPYLVLTNGGIGMNLRKANGSREEINRLGLSKERGIRHQPHSVITPLNMTSLNGKSMKSTTASDRSRCYQKGCFDRNI